MNSTDLELLEFLKDPDSKPTWVIVETKLRQAELAEELRNSSPHATVITVRDAITLLAAYADLTQGPANLHRSPRVYKQLSDDARTALLWTLLSSTPEKYPILQELLGGPLGSLSAQVHRGFPPLLRRLLTLFDAIRLNQTEERLLRQLMDEHGNTLPERLKLEELILLLDDYRLYQLEQRSLDLPGEVECAVSYFQSLPADKLKSPAPATADLPQRILLLEPTHLSALEVSLWEALGKFIELRVIIDDYIYSKQLARTCPSQAFVSHLEPQLARLNRGLKKRNFSITAAISVHAEGEKLVRALIDRERHENDPQQSSFADLREAASYISAHSCRTKREEAIAAALAVSELLTAGRAAAQIQIVVPRLSEYEDALRAEFSDRKIPFRVPKGQLLTSSPAYDLLRAFIDWIDTPTLETFLRFNANHLVTKLRVGKSDLSQFANLHPRSLAEIVNSPAAQNFLKGSELGDSFDNTELQLTTLRSKLESLLLTELVSVEQFIEIALQHVKRRLNQLGESSKSRKTRHGDRAAEIKELLRFVCDLAVLSREHQRSLSVKSEPTFVAQISSLQREFFARRASLSKMRLSLVLMKSSDPQLVRLALSFRNILHSCIRSKRLSALLPKEIAGEIVEIEPLRRFGFCKQLLLGQMSGQVFAPNPNVTEAVTFTELLDIRSTRGKAVIVLGLTNSSFPLDEVDDKSLADFEFLSRHVWARSGIEGPRYESLYLLGYLFRNAERLLFFYPERDSNGDPQFPPTFVVELASLSAANGVATYNTKPHHTPGSTVNQGFTERGVSLLRGRNSERFTAYDGEVSDASIAALMTKIEQQQPEQENGGLESSGLVTRYSISQLEMLADCPHRYYFKHFLNLHEDKDSLRAQISSAVGNIIHQALESFFKDRPNRVTADSFEQDCAELLRIACRLFSEDMFDWDLHPALRQAKQHIVLGLDAPLDAGKRGYLKGALIYQRDFLKSKPHRVEYKFGRFSEDNQPPLRVGSASQPIEISGAIDRIDIGETEGSFPEAVWDYKTGTAPSFSSVEKGMSLQVPLYAAAVRQNFPQHRYPTRGGMVVLKNANVGADGTEESESDSEKQVLKEHLALRRVGKLKTSFDATAVAENVERAVARVVELDQAVREGRFRQLLETESCEICEFSGICGRDESRLARKLQSLTAEPSVRDSQTRSRVEQEAEREDEPLRNADNSGERELSDEQERACDLTRDIALIAAAGSGKTTVLENRIVRLLLQGAELTSILAITFTEKAALEIRTRVERTLARILTANSYGKVTLSADQRSRLVIAQYCLRDAQLSTIHGFAASILQLAGALGFPLAVDEILTEGKRIDLLRNVIRHELSRPKKPGLTNLLEDFSAAVFDFTRLVQVLVGLISSPQSLARLCKSLGLHTSLDQNSALDLLNDSEFKRLCDPIISHCAAFQCSNARTALSDLITFLSEETTALEQWLSNPAMVESLTAEQKPVFQVLLNSARSVLAKALEIEKSSESSRHTKMEAFTPIVPILAEFTKFLGDSRPLQKRASSKKASRNFIKELADYLEDFDPQVFNFDGERERKALRIGRNLVQLASYLEGCFAEKKRGLGVLDFNDLIEISHRLICQAESSDGSVSPVRKALLSRLRSKFKHILVDEFQDTDEMQWNIIKSISTPEKVSTEKDRLPSRTLFIVGDPQQAIYGFRGGQVEVFYEAIREIIDRGGSCVTLANNYRSDSGIVEFINTFFQSLYDKVSTAGTPALAGISVNPNVMMNAVRAQFGTSPRLAFLYPSENSERSEERIGKKDLEARDVAGFIGNLLDRSGSRASLEFPAMLEHLKGSAGQTEAIAVLTRSGQEITLVSEALDQVGIGYRVSRAESFYECQEILYCLTLIRFLCVGAEHDPATLVGLLRTPFVGLSDREILNLYAELGFKWDRFFDLRHAPQSELLGTVRSHVLNFRRLAGIERVSNTLRRITDFCQIKAIFTEAAEFERLHNIERFIDYLNQAELRGEVTSAPESVLHWVERKKHTERDAPDTNDEGHPVVLSTIHGAKGLEYPMVILPFLEKRRKAWMDNIVGELQLGSSAIGNSKLTLLGVPFEDQSRNYARTHTVLMRCLKQTVDEISSAEEKRLFYVACTRAREYLVLSMRSPLGDQQAVSIDLTLSQSPGDWLRSHFGYLDTAKNGILYSITKGTAYNDVLAPR